MRSRYSPPTSTPGGGLVKNWKGKKYKVPSTGREYPMVSQWQYRVSPGPAGVKFTPEAKKHAISVLNKTKSMTEACKSVGCSFPSFRKWLSAAGIDHTQYKKSPGGPGPKKSRKGGKKKDPPRQPGGRAVTVAKKKRAKSSKGNRFDHNEIFMACYMHRHGFSNDDIRKRIGSVSDKTLERWYEEYGVEMDLSVIDQADRIQAKLALSNGSSEKEVSKEYDINLGVVEALKREMEEQISGL